MEGHVSGAPTKTFFIHTITKDISLEDCILDLIDNSLDGASRQAGRPEPSLGDSVDLSGFWIRIDVKPESFTITDNCGGISLDDAVNYAFTFGSDDKPEEYSIGLYGIGMKRAVFKMGREVSIVSRFDGSSKEPSASFRVPIDVPAWRKSPSWDFNLEEYKPLPEPGVQLSVSKLYDDISNEFKQSGFVNRLRALIARDYSHFIDSGIRIFLNDKVIKAFRFEFLSSDAIKPYRDDFKLKGVGIEIVAGIAARPAESYDPGDDDLNEDRSGWYVVCNGRIVLAADKSDLTGWGYQGRNRWHPQYRGFVGIITFTAKNASELPLTTTKRSIDSEREIYRLALVRMMELTRVWIDYTNSRKVSLPQARPLEEAAKPVVLAEVARSSSLALPKFQKPKTAAIKETTIQYPKPPERIRALAVAMGDAGLSAREVGLRSFDFAYKELGAGQF